MELNRQQLKGILALRSLKELRKIEMSQLGAIRRDRGLWVNPFLEKREFHDLETHLLKDLLWESGSDHKNFCRMIIHEFEALLALVEPQIEKQDIRLRYAITARVRLAIALWHISTGDSYRSLEFLSHVSRKTISVFVPEVLSAVYKSLQVKYLKMPTTQTEWLEIVQDFEKFWDFPHTLAALGGKHVRIKSPPHSGSDYFNYKGYFSIVLLAAVNAHSKFVYIEVGANGRASDSIIFNGSYLYQALKTGNLHIPPPSQLKGQQTKTPYFLIGDGIFKLDENVMKAYDRNNALTIAQEAFNYRLSRARLTVEMAFGRLVSRFRIFHRSIEVSLNNCDIIVKTCCVLHNYLSKDIKSTPDLTQHQSEKMPENIRPLGNQYFNTYKFSSRYRDNLCKYVVTDGDVPFSGEK